MNFIFGFCLALFALLVTIYEYLAYVLMWINPFMLWCKFVHKAKWQDVYFEMPYGIGGRYKKSGIWCEKCKKLYCGKKI